jgi:hypothetical protein
MSYASYGLINAAGFKKSLGGETPVFPSYTPVASANITAFFIASDKNTITQSSNLVSQWDAKLGSGVATQATAADKPATNSSTLNTYNILDFAGSGDKLLSNVDFDNSSGTDAVTIGILAKRDSSGSIATLSGQWSEVGGDYRRWKVEIDASNNLRLYCKTQFGIFDLSASHAGTNWTMYWVYYRPTGGTDTFLSINKNTNIGSILQSNTTDANIGTIFGDAAPNGTTSWNGNIASVCVWNKELTGGERNTEVDNINTFWGLSL